GGGADASVRSRSWQGTSACFKWAAATAVPNDWNPDSYAEIKSTLFMFATFPQVLRRVSVDAGERALRHADRSRDASEASALVEPAAHRSARLEMLDQAAVDLQAVRELVDIKHADPQLPLPENAEDVEVIQPGHLEDPGGLVHVDVGDLS